ncbi:hypothetical protein ACN28S_22485 [Cystobacter fuscus]
MQLSINRSGRTAGAGFMLALSWLAWGCGGEGSAREGQSVSEPGVQGSSTAPPPLASSTCDRIATNAATLASQWSAATAGQTICPATGSYGTFTAGTKPGVVTVKPQSGATATLAVRFNGANNVRLEGLTITSAALLGSTRDVTITGSRFTGAATIDGVVNSNILFDGNTHLDINAPTGSAPARIHLPYSSSTHSGVTIQNSRFEGATRTASRRGWRSTSSTISSRTSRRTAPTTPTRSSCSSSGRGGSRQLLPQLRYGHRRLRRRRARGHRRQRAGSARPPVGHRTLLG